MIKFSHIRTKHDRTILECLQEAWRLRQIDRYHDGHLPSNRVKAITICLIDDGDITGVGYSFCSDNDQFSRKRGRQISYNRAKHDLGIVRMNRAAQEELHQESVLWPSMDMDVDNG